MIIPIYDVLESHMQFIQILTVRFHDDPCQLDYTDACSTAGPNFRIVLPDLSLIQII